MDGLIALLSLGLGIAAWWWVAKTLGAKGKGVIVRHLAGAATWFFGTTLLFGTAQAVGLVKPAEPSAAPDPKVELDREEAEPPAPTKAAPAPAAIKPTEKLTPKPSPSRGVKAEYLAAEFCPDHSPCYTFTDADRIEAARRGKSVHVLGTLTKAPSTPLFSDGPVAVLEGKQFCSVSLEFGDGDDRVLDMKQGQTVSARCVYEKGGEKGVSLKNCKLVPASSSVEPLPFSWNEVAIPELPPLLEGMSPAEVDQLYRAVLVDIWNGQVTMGRDHARVYASLAEKIGVHVDKLKAAHEYVEDKQKALAYGFRLLLDRDPKIAPEYYGPVGATA